LQDAARGAQFAKFLAEGSHQEAALFEKSAQKLLTLGFVGGNARAPRRKKVFWFSPPDD
jgi:hypothetical protein